MEKKKVNLLWFITSFKIFCVDNRRKIITFSFYIHFLSLSFHALLNSDINSALNQILVLCKQSFQYDCLISLETKYGNGSPYFGFSKACLV